MKYTLLQNENNIAVSKSINYSDILSGTEIEITEEQYNQINEFPLKLNIENGKVIALEKTIIEPNLEEIQKQLEKSKIEKTTQTKQQLAEFLESHPLQYNGEYYSITQEKQALLTSSIAAYQLKVQAGIHAILKWNTTGDVCREFTIEEITGLVISITDYVQPRVEKQQALEMQIRNCTTQEELDNIIIDYEVM
nr:hypothetical protein [Sedimentibacter sp.]